MIRILLMPAVLILAIGKNRPGLLSPQLATFSVATRSGEIRLQPSPSRKVRSGNGARGGAFL